VSEEPEELSPDERRVRALLGELRDETAPRGEELTSTVVRTARWQRPVRRVLMAFGTAAGAVAAGAGASYRAYRRR
jgi:hypothetical protein